VACLVLGLSGFLFWPSLKSAPLSYFVVFLGAGGIYPCISNTITWVGNNCDGVYRRGITLGAVIAWGNMNGGNLPCLGFSSSFKSGLATFTAVVPTWPRVVFLYLSLFLFCGSVVNYFCLIAANRHRRGPNGRLFTL
jgi:hypothetical protein